MPGTRNLQQRVRNFKKLYARALRFEILKQDIVLAAAVQENFAVKGSEFFNTGNRVRVDSNSRLFRATIAGNPGNIFRLVGDLKSAFTLTYGIDPDKIPEARAHEHGVTIPATPGMISKLFHLSAETGREEFTWIALSARRKGFITIPQRPYMKPGMSKYRKVGFKQLMSDVKRVAIESWKKAR